MRRVLLVEDEVHKRDEMRRCVQEVYGVEPELVDCVRDAVVKVMEEDYDLIILDMALSTFGESSDDKIKGHDQAQGGVEVLRTLHAAKKQTKIIIVTQYPDFLLGSTKVKLKQASKVVVEKYGQEVIGAVLYQYKSISTLQRIMSILRAHG